MNSKLTRYSFESYDRAYKSGEEEEAPEGSGFLED